MGWRRAGQEGTGSLARRVARLEHELKRLQEAHRLSLAYLRGLDEDLAAVEDRLPAASSGLDGAGSPAEGADRDGGRGLVFVACERCRRTVALDDQELGAFTDPIHCPYCGAELMRAWKPPASR